MKIAPALLVLSSCTDPSTKVAAHKEPAAAVSSNSAGAKPDQSQYPKDVPAIVGIPLAAAALPMAIVIAFLHLDQS